MRAVASTTRRSLAGSTQRSEEPLDFGAFGLQVGKLFLRAGDDGRRRLVGERLVGQPRLGAGYVHGARSRFLTEAVLARFERSAWPAQFEGGAATVAEPGPQVDVAAQLRKLW